MFEIMLLPHSLHIKYDAADDSESVSISTVEYLFIRHAFVEAGYTELPDGNWTEAPANLADPGVTIAPRSTHRPTHPTRPVAATPPTPQASA